MEPTGGSVCQHACINWPSNAEASSAERSPCSASLIAARPASAARCSSGWQYTTRNPDALKIGRSFSMVLGVMTVSISTCNANETTSCHCAVCRCRYEFNTTTKIATDPHPNRYRATIRTTGEFRVFEFASQTSTYAALSIFHLGLRQLHQALCISAGYTFPAINKRRYQ